MRGFSPRVTKLLFAVLVILGSLSAGAAVVFVTPIPAPASEPSAPCTVTESPD